MEKNECKDLKDAIDKNYISRNLYGKGRYYLMRDIYFCGYDHTEEISIKHCPFCGEEL